MGKFIATFIDIKDIDKVPEEIAPYVNFKRAYEEREIKGDERVAVFNIASTHSYAVVFLDAGKTVEDVEAELERESSAILNAESRAAIRRALG